MTGYGHGAWLWIGGYDVDYDGTFSWTDGSPVNDNYFNWYLNQPDALSQRCLALVNTDGAWAIHDGDCDITMSSICELYL